MVCTERSACPAGHRPTRRVQPAAELSERSLDARLRCRCPARRVPGPRPPAGRSDRRVPRRPRRHPGPAARHRRRQRLLHERQREQRRRVHDERAERRDGRGGPRGRGRLPGRGEPGRDQVRLQHVDAHPPHRAQHRRDARARRRDRRHDPRPRGECLHLGGDGADRGVTVHKVDIRDGRRHARPRGPRIEAHAADEARRRGLRQQRGRDDQPGRRDRRPRPRGRGAHLRRRRRVRAARADRCPRARHRLPRLQRLQVVRAAPRRAVRQGRGPRFAAGLQGAPRARPVRDRARPRSSRSPARSPRPTTCATSGARTATWPARRGPPRPASAGASSSRG